MTDQSDSKKTHDDGLTPEQRAAVEFGGRHLLVLAGAGAGKTKTIVERAKFLIRKGADPKRILILSFTNKSANEIVERIAMELGDESSKELTGQTFHSWCARLIKSQPKIFAQSKSSILDEDDRATCVRLIAGKTFKKDTGITPDEVISVYSYAVNTRTNLTGAIKKHLMANSKPPKDLDAAAERTRPVMARVIEQFIAYKRERRLIDYDDLLMVVSEAMKRNGAAREHIAGMYDHILVDEMQDTNPLQYELLSSFWGKCRLFCVGDDAQSIYAFRGADFKTIHSFTSVVPGSEAVKLTVNFRSTQEILDVANWLLRQSPLAYDKDLRAARGAGGAKPVLANVRDDFEQAEDVVERILEGKNEEGFAWRDNLVLSRSAWGLRRVEGLCIKHDIPYLLFGGLQLMKSRHIRDIVAALKIVVNHRDELAWTRYLLLWPGIGEITAAKIVAEVTAAESFEEALEKLDSQGRDGRMAMTLRTIAKYQEEPARAIRAAVDALNSVFLASYEDWNSRRKPDFEILSDIAKKSEDVSSFLAEFVLNPSLDKGRLMDDTSPDDYVTLSTIHSAKGLEARRCYVLDVSVGSFPSARALGEGDDTVEEERRCLYVAFTRAKDRLFIYRNPLSPYTVDSKNSPKRRYFLEGLPRNLYEERDVSAYSLRLDKGYQGEAEDYSPSFDFS